MTSVAVVTPWKDARELVVGYVRALEADPPDEVFIFDTGSVPPLMVSEFPTGWWLGPAGGYVDACNTGLAMSRADAVLWLNNDVVAVHDAWLAPIRRALRPGRLVGAQLRSEPHSAVDGRPVSYLDGWCLAGMREDMAALEGLDAGFVEPAYYSDNDFCLRARAVGMKLVEVEVGLRHIGNYTSKTMPAARERASAANRERYLAKARSIISPRLVP